MRNSAKFFGLCSGLFRKGARRIVFARFLGPFIWVIGLFANPAAATFHFMQIEQVIAGVNGDVSAQAIQLRMRSNGQELVDRAKLIVRDPAGENPIVLIDFSRAVPQGIAGGRVLVCSGSFSRYTQPSAVPDFTLEALIPTSYLGAGSLTFENDNETLIVWRLSWGGSAYTGSTGGAMTNDNDGEFGPPLSSALPTQGLEAVQFQNMAEALGSANLSDYGVTSGAAVFTNNAGAAFVVTPIVCDPDSLDDADHDGICEKADNCPIAANPDQTDDDGDGLGNGCDLCPNDANKSTPGKCGCGIPDLDPNGVEVADCSTGGTAGNMDDQLPDGGGIPPDSHEDDPSHPPSDAGGMDGEVVDDNNLPTESDPQDEGESGDGQGSDEETSSGEPVNPSSATELEGAGRMCGLGMFPLMLLSMILPFVMRVRRAHVRSAVAPINE